MTTPLHSGHRLTGRLRLFLLLWLAATGWLPTQAWAQSPGPDGGTLSPATSTVCSGFNSGTLTLSGFTGTVVKYQANNGGGYFDLSGGGGSPSYTFGNLTQTTSFRAVVQNGATPAVTSSVATVTVNQPPTATINSQGPTRLCQQGTIYLVAGPSGNYTYQFLRNGNNIAGATSQVYTATVTASGQYSVRVTDAASCSSVSSSIQIQVQPQSVVNLITNSFTTFCQGGSVTLIANTTGAGASGYTYQFNRDGNQIPGATSSTYTATTSGVYTVVVNNPTTCTATSNSVSVTVNQPPVVSFSYPAATYCQSGATNPVPTASPAGGSFAAPAGLSVNQNNGTINLGQSQPGTYAVVYTSSGTCPASANFTVTVTAPTTAGFSYTGGSRCAGTVGTLTPTLAAGATAGNFSASPAGLSLNAATGAVDLAQSQPGTYTVTNAVDAQNGCAATSATTQLVLTVQPVAALAAGGPTTFCQGGSVLLTANGGGPGAIYAFTNNGQPISGATGTTYSAAASGSYAVTIVNAGGCASTSPAVAVAVNPATTATFSYSGTVFCQTTASALTPTVTGTAGGTFSATPAGLSFDANTGVVTPGTSTPGAYTVTYAVGGPCPSSGTASLSISAQPVAALAAGGPTTFCQGGSVTLTASGGGATSTYQFFNNSQAIVGGTSASLVVSASGSYTVTITNPGSCAGTSAAVAVAVNPTTTATFGYGTAPYCQNAANPTPTVTGTAGGTFSAPTGLVVDPATGTVNLGASTAGTYTVTYSVGGPCPSTGTASVTLTAPAVATFGYAAATFCVGGASPSPVLASGASAGTFSSTAGLALNAATGALDLTQSQPGTYAVTNTVAARSGCPAATATIQVVISTAPVASLATSGPTAFCQGGSVLLTANGGGAGSTYQFLNNGQPIGGATGATYTASASGSYSVVITNAGACAGTSAATAVTVNPIATPTLSYSAASFCQGAGTAAATVSVSGGSFAASPAGLGLNAATGAIALAQSQPGTYTVTYTGGSPCPGSTAATVTITALPSAAFAYAGGATFCPTATTNPTPTITGATGGSFSAPAGLVIDPATGTINLQTSTAGTYAVTYAVAGSCPNSSTLNVTISAAPVATFGYAAAGGYCAGAAGTAAPTFTGGGSAGTFSSPGAGLVLNAATGVVNLAQSQPGTYTVTNIIAASGACTAVSAMASLTINTAPTATLGAGGPTTFCQGGSVTLIAPAGTGFMYQFLNNNQPIASATAATYTANSTGNYSVAVTNASGCTSTSPATSVTVNPATTATFAYPAASFCVSSSLATTPSITGTAGGTFSAPAGLGLNTATGALTPSASTPGTYTVTYTVAGPCSSTGSQSVTITAPARAAFGYASAAYCATGTAAAVLVAGSTAGAFSSTTGLSVNPITGALNLATSAAGTYTVTNTVAASGGCVGTTAMATVTVNPQPATPTLSAAYNGAVTTLTSSAATSNQFYLNGAPIAGATGPTYVVNGTPAQLGSYTVVTTNATGCASAPSAPLVVTPTRASRLTIDALTAFPNPTLDGRLTVTMNDGHSEARLVLFNALGQQVLTATLAASATTHELDLSGMASGVYTLRATTTDGTATRRVVRQ